MVAGGGGDAGASCDHSVPASVGGWSTLTFSETGITLDRVRRRGGLAIVGDPECGAGSANKVMLVGRSPSAMTYAGTVVATMSGGVPAVPFSAQNTRFSVRTRSEVVGIKVRLKLEDAADSSHSVEAEVSTSVANAWETLTFDFSNTVSGTPALNLGYTYNKLILFFDFGTAGSAANSRPYYADDIAFIGGGGSGTDAGTDAGTTDAGTTDAGTTDAGTTDAGTVDAGQPDAGVVAPFAVFVDDYNASVGAAFAAFGGSVNNVTRDTTNPNNGHASLKVVAPSTDYTGGAIVAATPPDLRAYNVMSFWAKASAAATVVNNLGFGDTAAAAVDVETHTTTIGTAWAKYYVPIPRPAALDAHAGLFYFAGLTTGTTVWFNDIQYEVLDATAYSAAVGAVTNISVNWPTPTIVAGATDSLDFNPTTVFYTTPTLYRVGWKYFSLTEQSQRGHGRQRGAHHRRGRWHGRHQRGRHRRLQHPGQLDRHGHHGWLDQPHHGGADARRATVEPGRLAVQQQRDLHEPRGRHLGHVVEQQQRRPAPVGWHHPEHDAGGEEVRGAQLRRRRVPQPGPIQRPGHLDDAPRHLDANATTFSIKIVTFNAAGGGNPEARRDGVPVQLSNLIQGAWNSTEHSHVRLHRRGHHDIGRSSGQQHPGDGDGTFFLDNIYFFQ